MKRTEVEKTGYTSFPHIIFLIFYFGKVPEYFSLFLQSCKYNPEITWRIYTDAEKQGIWPENVEYCRMTFGECRELFQSRLGMEISLETPKKLCDFKPAFGFITEEELKEFDYWGYCDLDMIFGRLSCFLPENIRQWDKIGTLGSLTLYRNDLAVNRAFMSSINGRQRWKEVFSSPGIFAFDEWGSETVNTIFDRMDYAFYREPIVADVWPERENFWLSGYDFNIGRYKPISDTEGVFRFREGRMYHLRMDGDCVIRTEVPCVHLQKRRFRFDASGCETYCGRETYCGYAMDSGRGTGFYILPRRICPDGPDGDGMWEEDAVRAGTRRHLVERQWVRIKYINLKNRLLHRRVQ